MNQGDIYYRMTGDRREDGSFLMVCRGGGVWFSKTGITPYNQVTDTRVYPPIDGRFEDPVVWRTHIQYHLIVNDWLGRIAYYLRSKDGIHWKVEPGEAYLPGIARYEDGTVVDWFKHERIKVLQFDLYLDYRLEDLGGRTRLTQDSEVRFKGFFRIVGVIVTPLVRKSSMKQLEDSFAKLKRLSETPDEQSADT